MKSEYLIKSQKDISNSLKKYKDLENKSEENLVRILVLVATIIIPLSTPVFFDKGLFLSFDFIQKFFFSSGWFLLLASLIIGLIYFILIFKYSRFGKKQLSEISTFLENAENKNDNEIYDYKEKEINKIPKETSISLIIIQICLLLLGLIFFAANIIIGIFF